MRKDCVIFCFNNTQIKIVEFFEKLHLLKINDMETYSSIITEKPEFVEVEVNASFTVHRFVSWILYKFFMDDISMDRAERLVDSVKNTEEGAAIWNDLK